jgi:hypothetical protein
MGAARDAEQQFNENFQRLSGDMEKYNLYAGLANVAKELQGIRSDLQRLQADVDRIARR